MIYGNAYANASAMVFYGRSNAFLVAVDSKYSELWISLLQWKWAWLFHSNNMRMFLKWCWHITLLPTLMDSSADDTCHGVRCSGVHAGRSRNRVITFLRSLGLSTSYCYVTYYYSTQMTWLIPTINKPCASEVVGSTAITNAPASSNISSCHGDKKDNSYTWRYGYGMHASCKMRARTQHIARGCN